MHSLTSHTTTPPHLATQGAIAEHEGKILLCRCVIRCACARHQGCPECVGVNSAYQLCVPLTQHVLNHETHVQPLTQACHRALSWQVDDSCGFHGVE